MVDACTAVGMLAIAVGAILAYGVVQGLAATATLAVVFAPFAWTRWFASRNARSDAWLEVGNSRLVLHHPVFLAAYFLARVPRRAVGVFNLLTRGHACAFAPHRNYWIRGLLAVAENMKTAATVLEAAGIERLPELTPEVLGWLAEDRPAPLPRAWRSLRRDRRRTEPGPLR